MGQIGKVGSTLHPVTRNAGWGGGLHNLDQKFERGREQRGGGRRVNFSFTFLSQEEQHRSHENCLDAASDDLLDLQRNLPERRGRGRELEEYRLRKEYLEHEVSSLVLGGQSTGWLGPLPPSPGCLCLRTRNTACRGGREGSGICEH